MDFAGMIYSTPQGWRAVAWFDGMKFRSLPFSTRELAVHYLNNVRRAAADYAAVNADN